MLRYIALFSVIHNATHQQFEGQFFMKRYWVELLQKGRVRDKIRLLDNKQRKNKVKMRSYQIGRYTTETFRLYLLMNSTI